jgi:hypothetical protein
MVMTVGDGDGVGLPGEGLPDGDGVGEPDAAADSPLDPGLEETPPVLASAPLAAHRITTAATTPASSSR